MRNIFDQYKHLENRVTHGLMQLLRSDDSLTRLFVRTFANREIARNTSFEWSCQTVPGQESNLREEELDQERKGIPDGWIYSENDGWAVLIESKITAGLTRAQLEGHIRTATRHFRDVHVLVITADELRHPWLSEIYSRATVSNIRWSDMFQFMSDSPCNNPVAEFLRSQFIEYLRIVETDLNQEGKILTMFTGVPFCADHQFNHLEAKIVLRALLKDFRPALASNGALPVAAKSSQKPLTGLWDVIPLAPSEPNGHFTSQPHLTLSMDTDQMKLELTLPNGATRYWPRLRRSVKDGSLENVLTKIASQFRVKRHAIRRAGVYDPRLFFQILHRHYPRRRSPGIVDGFLSFDLDTLDPAEKSSVKQLRAWLTAAELILEGKGSANLQVQLQACYPYDEDGLCRTSAFVSELVRASGELAPFHRLLSGD